MSLPKWLVFNLNLICLSLEWIGWGNNDRLECRVNKRIQTSHNTG